MQIHEVVTKMQTRLLLNYQLIKQLEKERENVMVAEEGGEGGDAQDEARNRDLHRGGNGSPLPRGKRNSQI